MQERSALDPLSLRPTWMEINLDHLAHNFQVIRNYTAPAAVMAVVKANAYGHGLVECARKLEAAGVESFGVAFVEEGIKLRQAGIRAPILVLGGIAGSQIGYFLEYDLDITASSVSKFEAIEHAARRHGIEPRVHLKIDTGMERIGVHYYSADELLRKAIGSKVCHTVGIFSHFSTVKDGDLLFAQLQLDRFLEVVRFFERSSHPAPRRHIANSAAMFTYPESHLDMLRIGVALFGADPSSEVHSTLPLKPVMRLRSEVVFFKVVKKGAGVSYCRTWIAPEDTRVVTIPIGYGDGYPRALSNRGMVLIRGHRYPIVGTVCMDQAMVSIGGGEAYCGDEVILLGTQGDGEITVNEVAEWCDTDPRVVMTGFTERIPRRFLSERGDVC